MKKLFFVLFSTILTPVCGTQTERVSLTPVCDTQTGRASITTKVYVIGIILFIVLLPFTSSAQPPFVIHMPFHGEPLFCHETACLRKAVMEKKIKKSKHKRQIAVRKMARKRKADDKKEPESNPMQYRMRPKFE